MRFRRASTGALAFGTVVLALFASSVPLQTASHMWGGSNTATYPVGIACLAVGVLLAARRPDNTMGWCMLSAALFLSLNLAASSYSVLDYRMHHGTLPLGWAAVLLQPSWAPTIVLLGLSILLFPDGHFSSRLTKWMTWLVLCIGAVWIAGALGLASQALVNHAVHVDRTGNLLSIDHPRGAWAWWSVAQDALFISIAATAVGWFVQQVPRYRRVTDERRHQMKWLLSGAALTVLCALFALTGASNSESWVVGRIGTVGLVALPVSIAIGVMKFRLYDIDRIISRTFSYAILSGVVVGVYIGTVTLATRVVGFSSSIGVAASTLIAAALFNPVRKRAQRVVDGRFNRAHYDAQRTVSAFAARLRDAVDPDTVRDDLIEVVHTAFEPSVASVWFRSTRPTG